MPQSVSDLSDSAETKIFKAVGEILRGGQFYDRDGAVHTDTFFSEAFFPIVLVEAPTQRDLEQFAQGTLAVMAGVAGVNEMPSDRDTLSVPIFFLAYLPYENVSEDTKFSASNVCGKLRELLTRAQVLRFGGEDITFATVTVRWVDAKKVSGTLIAAYRAVYEADIEPTSGSVI